jgi:hypothetical protein
LKLREDSYLPNACLFDFLVPTKFKGMVAAAKALSGAGDNGFTKIPSLALKFGHDLKKLSKILISEAIQRGENPAMPENFLKLIEMSWSEEMFKNAPRTMKVGNFKMG